MKLSKALLTLLIAVFAATALRYGMKPKYSKWSEPGEMQGRFYCSHTLIDAFYKSEYGVQLRNNSNRTISFMFCDDDLALSYSLRGSAIWDKGGDGDARMYGLRKVIIKPYQTIVLSKWPADPADFGSQLYQGSLVPDPHFEPLCVYAFPWLLPLFIIVVGLIVNVRQRHPK